MRAAVFALLAAHANGLVDPRNVTHMLGYNGQVYELRELGLSHKAKYGRMSDKFTTHPYETMYGIFLAPLRGVPGMRMLEIGLGCNMNYGPGASVKVWREYLPHAELWEAELDADCVQRSKEKGELEGINTLTGPQGEFRTLMQWKAAAKRAGPRGGFDVIIDDGSHFNSDMLHTFDVFWNDMLNPGGLYFIEDVYLSRTQWWDDTGGEYVIQDVLSSWVLQLTENKLAGGKQDRHTRVDKRQPDKPAVPADKYADDSAVKFPLPRFVHFIFCQQMACVIGSCSERDRIEHCAALAECGGKKTNQCRVTSLQCCPDVQPPRDLTNTIPYAKVKRRPRTRQYLRPP